jgi:hypothetical protein
MQTKEHNFIFDDKEEVEAHTFYVFADIVTGQPFSYVYLVESCCNLS